MIANPRVSVLLPVHQAESTLSVCLSSLRRQDEQDWECVLVDDGSTDGGADQARAFSARDPRVKLVRSRHAGLVAALNAGLAECRGRFVARMDADDLMHRRRLVEQADLLAAHPDWAGVGCHVRMFPRASLGPGNRAYEAWLNAMRSPEDVRREAFIECPVAHPTWMFRREVLAGEAYRDRGWPEDYDLVLRLLTRGARIGVLARRRLGWRHGAGRLSCRSSVYDDERFTACKAWYLARSFLARTDRYILWGYGATGRTLRRELLHHGKQPSHIVELHPGRLGNRIHGAPVIPIHRLPEIPPRPVVVSVAGAVARGEIRKAMRRMGFVETRDFVCAA